MSEERERAEKEQFGEAELGDAQAENPAPAEEMIEGEAGEPAGDARGPADEPAVAVPVPVTPEQQRADEQAELAARDAARIGGDPQLEDVDEADRPVVEAGGGEAEGFELAEEQLEQNASHGDASGHPLADRFPAERENPADHTAFGEADDVVHRETVESQDPDKEGQS